MHAYNVYHYAWYVVLIAGISTQKHGVKMLCAMLHVKNCSS